MTTGARLHGTPVVPGTGYGPALRAAPRPAIPPVASELPEPAREAERERFRAAVAAVAERLEQRAARATGQAAEVLATTATMAADPTLAAGVEKAIADGVPAVQAVASATAEFTAMFSAAGGLMAERVTDLEDIRDRVVAELLGHPEPGVPHPDEPSVLVADDLAPADAALLDPALVVALATRLGGPTSHTAIIARQLGIPCVVAVPDLGDVASGTPLLVDGGTGEVVVAPDEEEAETRVRAARELAREAALWRGEGRTSDGHAVDILANVADGAAAREAAQGVAQGVGLFRTELCFLSAATEPSVEQQTAIYAEVLKAFPGRKVVVRTLDAGSDKPLVYAGLDEEANPALGVRGLRIAMDDPGILDRQLDAIAAAAGTTSAEVWVMAPMVATVAEAAFFAERVRARGLTAGIMVEVPAAALLADALLAEVDFVSIGTNDLTQYTMAADRLSPSLASLSDPWQPAVLRLVGMTAEAGQRLGKPVGVCGEAAADPVLAAVLVGLGVTSLSAAAAALPAVGARLSRHTLEQCRQAATAVLATSDPVAARDAARAVLEVE
ncbi:MAG TPA: phosphoenolpyruvate--protein phosphotransferase [Actinotalea caeni]|uniref:phosphoenolpyruvate--protein phosphotransferase n=1 Tax=Actinotalea caeni TaxID=1348467 RepID=UPI002B4B3E3A|nr:phosphoenolpyruvate--protein phosphotransferase [Actinotalea caeni]HLV54218.1 phosphoenolpyruvate--protein phosphotransferase [Actinotalea caeni]